VRLSIALFSVLAANLCHAQQSQRPEAVDISSNIFRGLSIPDEPSIKAKCDASGYAGFRVFEYEAMTPIRILRVERNEGSAQLSIRNFESNGTPSTTAVKPIDATRWQQLVDVFAQSAFWTTEVRDSFWIPEGVKWLVEGCENGTFHSLLLYPEQDRRMHDVTESMAAMAR
jgi:hypothetical protein